MLRTVVLQEALTNKEYNMNITTKLTVPSFMIIAWVLFEIIRFIRIRKGKKTNKLLGWILRPWSAWAIVNLIYQLNPSKGLDAMDTAPHFTDWIFPIFLHPWNKGESLPDVFIRLTTTPTVYIWGAIVAILTLILTLFIKLALSNKADSWKKLVLMLVGIYLLIGALQISIASLPNGPFNSGDRKGSLLSCWQAHSTMLYSVPFVSTKGYFLRNFSDIQPKLKFTIHALSHPPGGVLSMYYIGRVVGAGGMNIRLDSTRIRYTLGMTFFAALNIFILFGMGKTMFGGNKHGFIAAILWNTAPVMLAYSNYAQDGLYAVFFNLALLLTWRIGMGDKRRYLEMIILGLVFSLVIFMNYSWTLLTTIFTAFMIYRAVSVKWKFYDLVIRGVIPLAIMTIVAGSILVHYNMNYIEFYKVSSCFVKSWYQFDTIYQHIISWVGGQVEIWLFMGAISCSAFFASIYARKKERSWNPQLVFLAIILAVYVLPVLFGPTCLRLETSRCWLWVTSVPACFAAHHLLSQSRPRLFVTAAVLFSVGSYSLIRLFLNF